MRECGGAPLRGAGKCGEGRWLAAPPRGRTFFRWHGGAGEARQLQNPHLLFRGKEDAPFDGVEEKAGAAAFQTLFETPCSALLRGLWPGSRCWPCPLYPLLTPTELRVPPGCSAVLFSLPHPDIRGSVPPILQIPRNHRIAAAKQKQGASLNSPNVRNCHIRLSGQRHRPLPVQNPRKRRCERSGRSPECRRPAFFS